MLNWPTKISTSYLQAINLQKSKNQENKNIVVVV